MSKRWKTTRPVLVGDPEYVIRAERAKELMANTLYELECDIEQVNHH